MEYCLSVQFNRNSKSYYFKTEDENIKKDDLVVVESVFGMEIVTVVKDPIPIEKIKFPLKIKPITRKATPSDIKIKRENDRLAKQAAKVFVKSVTDLGLDMTLIETNYTLDKTKVLFCYLASDRVDFRELLKVLASKLNCRIELKQINPRDKAQMVGGIGVCGLELCCTKFLTVFEGISLTKAKNQMLSINIPKLSGQCGKLMCCLKYEDDYYTEEKKNYPAINSHLIYQNKDYKVTSINIFSQTIRAEGQDGFEILTLDQYNKIPPKNRNIGVETTATENVTEENLDEDTSTIDIVEDEQKEENKNVKGVSSNKKPDSSNNSNQNKNNQRNQNYKKQNNNYRKKNNNKSYNNKNSNKTNVNKDTTQNEG